MDVETHPLWTTTREAMGKRYTIGLWPNDSALSESTRSSERIGAMDHVHQTIHLNPVQPPDGRDETLLHEILHRVDNQLLNDKLSEETIDTLSAGLFAFLRGFGLWRDFPWPDREPVEKTRPARPSSSTVGLEQHAMCYGEQLSGNTGS